MLPASSIIFRMMPPWTLPTTLASSGRMILQNPQRQLNLLVVCAKNNFSLISFRQDFHLNIRCPSLYRIQHFIPGRLSRFSVFVCVFVWGRLTRIWNLMCLYCEIMLCKLNLFCLQWWRVYYWSIWLADVFLEHIWWLQTSSVMTHTVHQLCVHC